MTDELSILIVNWNTGDHLSRALDRLLALPDHAATEIIVVDNGSTDDSVDLLRRHAGRIRLIEAGANLGYGAGMNRAAAEATGRHLLILNSDAEPVPGALDKLLAHAKRAGPTAMLGPRLLNNDGSIQGSVSLIHRLRDAVATSTIVGTFGLVRRRRNRLRLEELDQPLELDEERYLWGAAMLLERDFFHRLGGFDERFFLFFEDEDFCRRVREEGGCVVYVPSATFLHRRGLSREQVRQQQQFWYYRSYFRYLKKHSPRDRFNRWRALFFPTFVMDLLWNVWRDALRIALTRREKRRALASKVETRLAILTRFLPRLARELI